jgi:hypothetical protein
LVPEKGLGPEGFGWKENESQAEDKTEKNPPGPKTIFAENIKFSKQADALIRKKKGVKWKV